MNDQNINEKPAFLNVLVAPLDWGLGHATRCIPIIHELLKHNIKLFLAAEGAILILLKKEFPGVTILPLKGYNIRYGKTKSSFQAKMALQAIRIFSVIRYEKKWLKKTIESHHINAVISDNRFGLHNKNILSIYITHQLFIETGNSLLNALAQKIHFFFINKFNECWVPDSEGKLNLAGKLSHPDKKVSVPVKYLGVLSRFQQNESAKVHDLLIMLSGPEPQRTFFENKLLLQIKNTNLSIVFVRGLPATSIELKSENSNLRFFNHLSSAVLSGYIQQSKMVIARSGYSTIMDLAMLQQKAILVPTPGQTEQEYLAAYLQEKKFFLTMPQEDFDLSEALNAAEVFDYKKNSLPAHLLQQTIDEFITGLDRIV